MLELIKNGSSAIVMSDNGDIIRSFKELSEQRLVEVQECVDVVNIISGQSVTLADVLRKRLMVYDPLCDCAVDDLLITYMVAIIGNPNHSGSSNVLVSESLFVMLVKLFQLDHSIEEAVKKVVELDNIRINTFVQYCKYRMMNYVSIQTLALKADKTFDMFIMAYITKLGQTKSDKINPTDINKYMSLKLKELAKEFLA